MSPDQARGAPAGDPDPSQPPRQSEPPHPGDRDTDLIADNLQWVTEPALAYLDLDQLLREMLHRVTRILGVDTSAVRCWARRAIRSEGICVLIPARRVAAATIACDRERQF